MYHIGDIVRIIPYEKLHPNARAHYCQVCIYKPDKTGVIYSIHPDEPEVFALSFDGRDGYWANSGVFVLEDDPIRIEYGTGVYNVKFHNERS